jgi:Flp pilus assembly protein TadD
MKADTPNRIAAAVVIGVWMLFSIGAAGQGASAGQVRPASGKPEALQAVAELRAEIEKSALEEPMRLLSHKLGALPSARLLNNFAMALVLARVPANALVVLTEAARKYPENYLAFNNLGALLNNLGRYDRALVFLRYADGLSPDNATVLSNIGVAELGRGNEDDAEKFFLRAVSRWPRHPEANYALGMLRARAGDSQTARDFLNRSIDGAYTDKAARALRDLDRAARDGSRRGGGAAGRTPEPPPPLQARAVAAGKDLRLQLPVLDEGSLPAFVESEKGFETMAKQVQQAGVPIALELKSLANPLEQPPDGSPAMAGRTVLRLGDGKAGRLRDEAMRWRSRAEDLVKAHGDFFRTMVKDLAIITAEHYRIYSAEMDQCLKLKASGVRSNCEEEVRKRACGRYFEAVEPLYREFVKEYGQFAPSWESTALGYLQAVNYAAGFLDDPLEARRRRLAARLEVNGTYRGIVSEVARMAHGFGPPNSDCFKMPPPPPPTGELRIEDYIVPCSFRGIELDLAVVSLSVDCTKVTIGGDIGPAVAELEWNFVEKTGTFFIGVEESVEGGDLIGVEAGAKMGLAFSFDADEIMDIKFSAEAEASGSLDLGFGPIDLGSLRVHGEIGLDSAASFGWK